MSELQIIPLKNNLLLDFRQTEIRTKIITRLSELGLTNQQYKMDNELLTLVCNLVEHLVMKKDNISKKDLVISILVGIFELTEEEKATLSNNIEFLWSNSLIKKVSFYKLFKVSVREYFKKKG